jgi:hypothetical protein
MSVLERRVMVERPGENLSVRRQCELLQLARSGVYRPVPTGAGDLVSIRRLDELHLKWPFYGSRRMMFELNQAGHGINRKRVQRLMRVMGIEALVPRPGSFLYLVAIIDWASRAVLAWRLSYTRTPAFVARRSTKLWRDTARRRYSTSIRAAVHQRRLHRRARKNFARSLPHVASWFVVNVIETDLPALIFNADSIHIR